MLSAYLSCVRIFSKVSLHFGFHNLDFSFERFNNSYFSDYFGLFCENPDERKASSTKQTFIRDERVVFKC